MLKIDTKGEQLPTLTLADTRNVQVGDLVLAIGNPFGVGQSVASGIVSALARTDVGASDFGSFIQTDASINPGNSGGALVDMQGRLVGVNTMIFSRGGGSNGVGFAIPAEMVKRVVDAAVRGGSLVRPWLGAKGETIDSAKAAALGLDRPRGVLISAVYAGGPADKAGLRQGDVVLTVDGREVFDERGMKFIAATKAEGETVTLSTLRNGQTRQVSVRMAAPPGASKAEVVQVSGQNPFTGAVVAELSPALAEELGLDAFNGGMWVYSVPPRTIARKCRVPAGRHHPRSERHDDPHEGGFRGGAQEGGIHAARHLAPRHRAQRSTDRVGTAGALISAAADPAGRRGPAALDQDRERSVFQLPV